MLARCNNVFWTKKRQNDETQWFLWSILDEIIFAERIEWPQHWRFEFIIWCLFSDCFNLIFGHIVSNAFTENVFNTLMSAQQWMSIDNKKWLWFTGNSVICIDHIHFRPKREYTVTGMCRPSSNCYFAAKLAQKMCRTIRELTSKLVQWLWLKWMQPKGAHVASIHK